MKIDLEAKIPRKRKERLEAHGERLVKMMLGKTPKQAKVFIKNKVQDGTITRDEVLLGLVGAMTYVVNHVATNND